MALAIDMVAVGSVVAIAALPEPSFKTTCSVQCSVYNDNDDDDDDGDGDGDGDDLQSR